MTLVVNRNITEYIFEILGDEVVELGHMETRKHDDINVEILNDL